MTRTRSAGNLVLPLPTLTGQSPRRNRADIATVTTLMGTGMLPTLILMAVCKWGNSLPSLLLFLHHITPHLTLPGTLMVATSVAVTAEDAPPTITAAAAASGTATGPRIAPTLMTTTLHHPSAGGMGRIAPIVPRTMIGTAIGTSPLGGWERPPTIAAGMVDLEWGEGVWQGYIRIYVNFQMKPCLFPIAVNLQVSLALEVPFL